MSTVRSQQQKKKIREICYQLNERKIKNNNEGRTFKTK